VRTVRKLYLWSLRPLEAFALAAAIPLRSATSGVGAGELDGDWHDDIVLLASEHRPLAALQSAATGTLVTPCALFVERRQTSHGELFSREQPIAAGCSQAL
jgi:hypothetical protein